MNQSQNFIEALKNNDIALLRTISKTDFHNHFFFGTRRRNIEQWANCSIPPPPKTFKTLDEMFFYANNTFVPYISSQEGIDFMLGSAIRDAIDDGVTLLEMSIDSRIISLLPSKINGIISSLRDLQTRNKHLITLRPELGISRDRAFKEIQPIAKACIESGVFSSIDLYGNEPAKIPETYKTLYADAKRSGMKLKAHVGEFGSAESIRHTVEVLELDEVQHGITASGSVDIMKWLAQNKIQLNICPTSNVMLSRVSKMQNHPIRILHDQGIPVTINTDDLSIFNQSVSEEYLNLFQEGVLNANELDYIRQRSLIGLEEPKTLCRNS